MQRFLASPAVRSMLVSRVCMSARPTLWSVRAAQLAPCSTAAAAGAVGDQELPVCCQAAPYKVDLEAGKRVSWCSCGLSERQPFCDGKHKGTGWKPVRYTPEEDQPGVYFCGCKETKTPPFCDGSHNALKAE